MPGKQSISKWAVFSFEINNFVVLGTVLDNYVKVKWSKTDNRSIEKGVLMSRYISMGILIFLVV